MTITQRYGLSRSSRKHKCPACGRNTFTYYVDRGYNPTDAKDRELNLQQVDGEYILGTDYGWCDRENSCAYHRTPKDFFQDRRINGNTYHKAFKPIEETPKAIIPIDSRYVSATMFRSNGEYRTDSTLMQYILSLPLDDDELKTLSDVVAWYRVGVCKQVINEYNRDLGEYVTSNGNGTMFWMIDAQRRVRNGKKMYYKPDGHRDHNIRISTVKAQLIESGYFPQGYEVAQCLFGEHLLTEPVHEGKTVYVVESEKTAIICATLMPQYLWMACSSKGCASPQHLQPLKDDHRKIVLMPDLDGYWTHELDLMLKHATDEKEVRRLELRKKLAWTNRMKSLTEWYDNIYLSDYVLHHALPEDGDTCDIGDILIRKLYDKHLPFPPTEPLKTLIKNFNCTLL